MSSYFTILYVFFTQVKKGSGLTSVSARANADQEIDEILKVRYIDNFDINVAWKTIIYPFYETIAHARCDRQEESVGKRAQRLRCSPSR